MNWLPTARLHAAYEELLAAADEAGGECIVTMSFDGMLSAGCNTDHQRLAELLGKHLSVATRSATAEEDG